MSLINLHQSRHAVCLAEDKIMITYYHFLDVLLIHTLIKLLNLACSVLTFPKNALTKTNSACRLILKRNNHSITCFSVVMHTSPRVQGVQSHIAGKYLQQKFLERAIPFPETVIPWPLEAAGKWARASITYSGYSLYTCSETVTERTLELEPGEFDSGSSVSPSASHVRPPLILGTRFLLQLYQRAPLRQARRIPTRL